MGAAVCGTHVFSWWWLQGIHLGFVIKYAKECGADSSVVVQSGWTGNEFGLVDITEGVVGNLFYEAASNFKIMI